MVHGGLSSGSDDTILKATFVCLFNLASVVYFGWRGNVPMRTRSDGGGRSQSDTGLAGM